MMHGVGAAAHGGDIIGRNGRASRYTSNSAHPLLYLSICAGAIPKHPLPNAEY